MTIQVTGTLTDSGGYVSPNTQIRIKTIQGFGSTLRTATLNTRSDVAGLYDFNLAIGKHLIYVRYENDFELIGSTVVTSDIPSPLSIADLLHLTEPLLPSEILQVKQLVNQAVNAANSARKDADKVASDAQQVSENAAQVAQDKGSVDEAAEEIATAQAVIGTSIDGVYANAAGIVSINDTILRLHPII